MMPFLQDDTLAFEEDLEKSKNSLRHPYVTFFYLAFKGASIIAYLLCGWFSIGFIASFVTVILLLSLDFWTVKNISGRLMVGLRWWNYVDETGNSHWVFESRKSIANEREARIFWVALILTPFFWSLFFIVALFGLKLKWLLLVIIALILNGSNLYGYIKCRVGDSGNLSNVTSDFVRKQIFQNVVSAVTRQASTTPNNPSTNVI